MSTTGTGCSTWGEIMETVTGMQELILTRERRRLL